MALLDKMSILSAPDLKKETVPVPEWGEGAEVIVQEMSALDRDRLRLDIFDKENPGNATNVAAKILVRCLVDEAGARLFVDEEAEALGKKSLAAIQRLFVVAQRLNAMAPPSENEIKNSEPGLSGSSLSDSP